MTLLPLVWVLQLSVVFPSEMVLRILCALAAPWCLCEGFWECCLTSRCPGLYPTRSHENLLLGSKQFQVPLLLGNLLGNLRSMIACPVCPLNVITSVNLP